MQAKRSPESCISSKLSSNSQRVEYKPSSSLGRCNYWYRKLADGETLLSPVSPTNLGASTYGAKTLSLIRITIEIGEHWSTFSDCAEGQHQETRKPMGLSSKLKDISVHVVSTLSQRIALLCKRHTRHSPIYSVSTVVKTLSTAITILPPRQARQPGQSRVARARQAALVQTASGGGFHDERRWIKNRSTA